MNGLAKGYDGTSERAVQKVLQSAGFISEYLWVTDEDIAREYLLTRGPLLLGTDWFESMFTPIGKGSYIEPAGALAGGHEIVVRWYYNSAHRKYPDSYEIINSWGEGWGEKGLARIKAEDFRYLCSSSAQATSVLRRKQWGRKNDGATGPRRCFRPTALLFAPSHVRTRSRCTA
jgi:hypothetical protein